MNGRAEQGLGSLGARARSDPLPCVTPMGWEWDGEGKWEWDGEMGMGMGTETENGNEETDGDGNGSGDANGMSGKWDGEQGRE